MLPTLTSSDDSQSRRSQVAVDSSSSVSAGGEFESDTSSDSDDENILETISFLQAKQSLLQRAALIMKEEEAYNAATAWLEATAGVPSSQLASPSPPCDPQSPSDSSASGDEKDIWTEARELLDSMLAPEDAPPLSAFVALPRRKRCLPNPSHPCINTSRVQVVNSSTYEESSLCQDTQFLTTLPSSVYGQGQVSETY